MKKILPLVFLILSLSTKSQTNQKNNTSIVKFEFIENENDELIFKLGNKEFNVVYNTNISTWDNGKAKVKGAIQGYAINQNNSFLYVFYIVKIGSNIYGLYTYDDGNFEQFRKRIELPRKSKIEKLLLKYNSYGEVLYKDKELNEN